MEMVLVCPGIIGVNLPHGRKGAKAGIIKSPFNVEKLGFCRLNWGGMTLGEAPGVKDIPWSGNGGLSMGSNGV
jgi:hypothetical protein